jgi:hypothetical protein
LGHGQNNLLVLDSEDDISVVADFAFYEVIQQGKSLVQKYQYEYGPSNAVERGLLDAMVKAQSVCGSVDNSIAHERFHDFIAKRLCRGAVAPILL